MFFCNFKETPCGKILNHMIHKYKKIWVYTSLVNQFQNKYLKYLLYQKALIQTFLTSFLPKNNLCEFKTQGHKFKSYLYSKTGLKVALKIFGIQIKSVLDLVMTNSINH